MSATQSEQAKKQVSVFDPEERSRAVILPMLEQLGYAVDEHHTRKKILSRCSGEKRADMIFLHLAVFGQTYAEVTAGLEELKLTACTDPPPILAISVLKLSEEARGRLERLGCSIVLSRQAPLMEVVFAVNRLLFPKIRELRRYTRVFGGFEVQFGQPDDWRAGQVYNISREGAFVQTDTPPDDGQRIQLRFSLPGLDETLDVDAVVTWSNPPGDVPDPLSPPGMGINFLALGTEAKKTLGSFIAARENGSVPEK